MNQKKLRIFQKVTNLLKTAPIFTAKIRKPVFQKLVSLRKSRKTKRFKRLKHYNYKFMEEYEFSPSSTPLIYFKRKESYLQIKRRRREFYSMVVFLRRCFGWLKSAGRREGDSCSLATKIVPRGGGISGEILQPLDAVDDDEDSVDQRAERFIRRFYQDMRLQRQDCS